MAWRNPLASRAAYEQVSGENEQLRGRLSEVVESAELLSEDIATLERSLYEPGWINALHTLQVEFTPEGMRQLRAVCTLYAIKNPLIKRGLGLRAAYVWGRGINVTARSAGDDDGEQDVQAIIGAFLSNAANAAAFFSSGASVEREFSGFGTSGEIFAALFTKPLTGTVQIRNVVANEVIDVLTNPDNVTDEWYYHRCWYVPNAAGGQDKREVIHPAVGYLPKSRPSRVNGVRVRWDAPIIHKAVNRPDGWRRGIPDAYAAIDWAKAYRIFLEDWATLMRALAQYAWQTNVPGSKATAMRTRLAAPVENTRGEPSYAGRTAVLPPDVALQAISKTGADFDSGSGRPLAAMVAAALDVPVTMLLADPGSAGARATAETLDQPTELPMELRRGLWGDFYRDVCGYVIRESVRAPQGALKGKLTFDDFGAELVELDGDTDPGVDIEWPDIDQGDLAKRVDAIVKGNSTRVMPPELVLRLIAQALGVAGVDAIIDQMRDDDGTFKYPVDPLADALGPGALARGGGDPASAGTGPMGAGDDARGKNTGGNPSGLKA